MPNGNRYMADPKKPEVGDKFGKWTVIPAPAGDNIFTHVVCECGAFGAYKASALRHGASRQCKACAKASRAHSTGFLSKHNESKFPPCDPEKEADMIADFLETHEVTKCESKT